MSLGTRKVWLAVAASIALLIGCENSVTHAGTANCEGDSDCVTTLNCVAGYCVAAGSNQLNVAARIVTPEASQLLEQQVPPFTLGDASDLSFSLLETIEIYGVVRNGDDTFVSNVAGDLEAHAPGIIAGLDHRFVTRSSDGLNDAGEGYRLRLLPGRTYTVAFRPDDHELPPFTFQLNADQDLRGEYDITLPAVSAYDTLAGWVSWGASTPLRGARLTVLLPDGSALPSRVLDTVQAAFNLKVPPGVEQVKLRVAPTDESPLFPIFHTEWLSVADNVEVEVPPLPNGIEPFVARFKVRWPSTTDEQEDWSTKAGLKVVVSGHLESGTLTAVGTTDAEGVAELTLLPGAYDVLVDVGPGVPYGSHASKLNLQPAADAQAAENPIMIDLPGRHQITGLVLNAYGQPVVAGRVEARRRSSTDAEGQLAPSNVPYQAELQPDGRFELHVDTAVYELTIRPDASTDAPAERRSGLVVEADVDLTLTLPEAGLARISVLSPTGTPVASATVELYRADDPMSEPLVLVKGTTSETGTVEFLVPAEP